MMMVVFPMMRTMLLLVVFRYHHYFLFIHLIFHAMSSFYTVSPKVSGLPGSNCSLAHIKVTKFSVSDRLMILWVYPGSI